MNVSGGSLLPVLQAEKARAGPPQADPWGPGHSSDVQHFSLRVVAHANVDVRKESAGPRIRVRRLVLVGESSPCRFTHPWPCGTERGTAQR